MIRASLCLVLIVAFGLRVVGITAGLPELYDQDEELLLSYALEAASNAGYPGWFVWPAGVHITLLSIATYIIHFAQLLIHGSWTFKDTFNLLYTNPAALVLFGRYLSVIAGTVTVALVFMLARKLWDPRTGIIAAFLLAILPTHIEYSTLMRVDVPGTMLVVGCLLLSLSIGAQSGRSMLRWCGLLCGSAAVTKYPLGVVVLWRLVVMDRRAAATWPILARTMIQLRAESSVFVMYTLFAIFFWSPYLLGCLHIVVEDLGFVRASPIAGLVQQPFLATALWYLAAPIGSGWVASIFEVAVAIGFFTILLRREYTALSLSVVPLLLIMIYAVVGQKWDRWAVSLAPFYCLFIARGMSAWLLSKTSWAILGRAATIIALTLITWRCAQMTFAQWQSRQRVPVQAIAGQWISSHLPPMSGIAYEVYTPQLHRTTAGKFKTWYLGWEGVTSISPLTYCEKGFTYIVMGALRRRIEGDSRFTDQLERYRALERAGKIIKEFVDPSDINGYVAVVELCGK